MNIILEKYRGLRPLNDPQTTDKMLAILVEVPEAKQEGMWLRDRNVGHACLFRHESFPGKVIEYVQGTQQDSVTTLYEESPVFESRATLLAAREALIHEIGRVLMAIPATVVVYDEGRERDVRLWELGTAQLFDTLAHFTHADVATL